MMKDKIFYSVLAALGLLVISSLFFDWDLRERFVQNLGATVQQVVQGGTGSSTLTGILIGNGTSAINTLTVGTNLTLTGTTLSASGGATSAFEIATTSDIAAPQLAYVTKSSGKTTLGSVATTTLTASSPLSLDNPVVKVGGSNSILSLNTSGAWSGTAGSLAANGANCSAGSFPLGVDASGAVETCTDAWTEAENTAAGYARFPFTPQSYGNSTSTALAIIGGFISNGSTTVVGLTSGLVGNNNGLLYGFASSSLFGYTPLNPTRAINTTFPLAGGGALTGDLTLTFGGLSTSSPLAAASGLLYATGVNTVASVSTSTAITLSITGNAGTATALAANGTNCSAGNYPLGIDASGNVEDCTAAVGGSAFPFTQTTFGATNANATSTLIGFTNGIYSLASSTIGSGAQDGGLTISGGATTTGVAIFNDKIGIGTTSPSRQLSVHGSASVSGLLIAGQLVATNTLAVTGNVVFSTYTDALLVTNVSGSISEYLGSSCTNQFPRSVNNAGAWTCATVGTADVSGLDISDDTNLAATWPVTLTGDTLTFGGLSTSTAAVQGNIPYFSGVNTFANVATGTVSAGTGISLNSLVRSVVGGALQIAIDLAANFAWTGAHDFGGATSLEIPNGTAPTTDATGELSWDTTSGQFKIYDGSANRVLSNGFLYPSFSYATSTAWTGTTTIALAPAFVGETWSQVMCFTDAGTLNVSFYDGTNRMDLLNASTTVGTFNLTTNNTFTAAEKRYVDIGTPASTPTKISCTVRKAITAD